MGVCSHGLSELTTNTPHSLTLSPSISLLSPNGFLSSSTSQETPLEQGKAGEASFEVGLRLLEVEKHQLKVNTSL